MVHRVGVVAVGRASVVSGSAPHQDEAYAASRHAIDTLKASVPIWKKRSTPTDRCGKPMRSSVMKRPADVHSGSEVSDLTSTHCPI